MNFNLTNSQYCFNFKFSDKSFFRDQMFSRNTVLLKQIIKSKLQTMSLCM